MNSSPRGILLFVPPSEIPNLWVKVTKKTSLYFYIDHIEQRKGQSFYIHVDHLQGKYGQEIEQAEDLHAKNSERFVDYEKKSD